MTLNAMASTVSEAVTRAVEQRLQGEAEDRSCRGASGRRRRCHQAARTRSKRGAERLVVADHDERAPSRLRALANSRSRNAFCRLRSSADVGSSATISSGRADQRPRRRDALLLADAQARRRDALRAPWRRARGLRAAAARLRFRHRHSRLHARAAAWRKLNGSSTLSRIRAVGSRLNIWKMMPKCSDAEAVARRIPRALSCRCRDVEPPRLRGNDPAQQTEERRLAAAGRTNKQHALFRAQR